MNSAEVAEVPAVSVDAPMQGRSGIVQALRELLATEVQRRELAEAQLAIKEAQLNLKEAQAKRLGAWGWLLQNQLDESQRQNGLLRSELQKRGIPCESE